MPIEEYIEKFSNLRTDKNRNRYPATSMHRAPHKPILLLADEPTGNLDPALSLEIMSLFEAFNRVGVTVLIASHNMELIARMGRRVLALHNGRLESDSQPPSTPAAVQRT